uniref:Uncharacterized protein n=1 Tax=Tanacetum cinerariifolium TaxID=118510 RepID=A0A699HB95_TANCI|nr:hypothetical protein [Tanacetum cinerariifolium]
MGMGKKLYPHTGDGRVTGKRNIIGSISKRKLANRHSLAEAAVILAAILLLSMPSVEDKEIFATILEDIQKWITSEAEAVLSILMGIDNDIYSTIDACLNAIEMWKEIKRLKQGVSINVQPLKTDLYWEFRKFTSQDEPEVVADDEASSKEKEIDKLMTLFLLSFKKIYKPTNNNLRFSSNTKNTNVDNTSISNRRTKYGRQIGSMIIRGQLILLGLEKYRYSGGAADWDLVLQLQGIWSCSKEM